MNDGIMRCGVCSTDFESASHPLYAADVLFDRMHRLGFASVQFAFSSVSECGFVPTGSIEIPAEIPASALAAIQAASARTGIPIAAVNGTFNMAHPDPDVRKEGIRRFPILCEAAKTLGAAYVTLCSGTRNPDDLWGPSADNDTPAAWEDMRDTVARCVGIAEKAGVTLAIESEASNIISTPEKARRIMDEVGSAHLKMILDCANLFHAGHAHKDEVRATLERAFACYGHDIVIAHGKDIREGDGIDFCATGRGIVDFAYTARLLREYGFSGDMFLHGIYDEAVMPEARRHWLNAEAASV